MATPQSADPSVTNNEAISDTNQSDISIQTIHTTSGCDICVPGSVTDLVSYVLMEQEHWFEPELEFLLGAAKHFKRAIDISALYGIYSLPLSHELDKIFVFESSPVTTWYLKQSIEKNNTDNITIISRDNGDAENNFGNFNLDDSSKLFSLDNIDLVIINLGGNEINILDNAQEFLANNEPLIVYRRNKEPQACKQIVNILKDSGYQCFYLVPGVQLLSPVAEIETIESSTTNLFFCKESTSVNLNKLGFLCNTLKEVNHNDHDSTQILDFFDNFPYSQSLKESWRENLNPSDTTTAYQRSLLYYFKSHDQSIAANKRVAYLMESFNSLSEAIETSAGLPQLLTLARISYELGLTSTALQSLSAILETFCSDQIMTVNEPFLATHPEFDQVDPGEQFGEWIFSSALQSYLWQKSFSSYFMGKQEQATLQGLATDPFVQARTERARQLLNIKLGD